MVSLKRAKNLSADERHNVEIARNLEHWHEKPVLRKIYRNFHKLIAQSLNNNIAGDIVELGSGIGSIKEVIPACIRTDIFPNKWIDQVENAYSLTFRSDSASNLILFDVFHHLQYPGTALKEFQRVLAPGGRVIIFDPALSLLGLLVFGLFHHEGAGLFKKLHWLAPPDWSFSIESYYSAQGNATKVFFGKKFRHLLSDWTVLSVQRYSALSYIASGGYTKPQIYPDWAYPAVKKLETVCDWLPWLFSTRMLVVLEKSI